MVRAFCRPPPAVGAACVVALAALGVLAAAGAGAGAGAAIGWDASPDVGVISGEKRGSARSFTVASEEGEGVESWLIKGSRENLVGGVC